MVEELTEPVSSKGFGRSSGLVEAVSPTSMDAVALEDAVRLPTGMAEFDRVIGGGLVPGSVLLVGGEPGIGKSTLLLSVAGSLSAQGISVLYVTGEESEHQTKLRAVRLGLSGAAIQLLTHTRLDVIIESIRRMNPQVVIIDSIQVMETDALGSAPGSIGQVRECAHELVRLVKGSQSVLFLVGHVTKEGSLAGPKVLEHLVDTVLHFEGEPTTGLRLLRCTKNRFGATHELGVFHMTAEGLVEVSNPSEMFLSNRKQVVPGCMVSVSLEGSRPLLAEVQALTNPAGFNLPRRRAVGVDTGRLSMLIAVLERRAGLKQLGQQDVFVSSLGGVRLFEPGADLAVVIAIASSLKDQPAAGKAIAIGEVGLTGEVRPVASLIQRLNEARRIGFERGFVGPTRSRLSVQGMQVSVVQDVKEALAKALQG